MDSIPPMLIAAIDDILEVVIPIVIMLFVGIGQLLGALKQGKQKKPPVQRQVPKLDDGPVGNAPPAGEDALRQEVDDFLRRVQGKPPRPKPQEVKPQAARPQAERPGVPVVPAGRKGGKAMPGMQPISPLRQQHPPIRPLAQEEFAPIRSQPLPMRPDIEPRGQGVSEHVTKHIDNSALALGQHAEKLGDELAETDERLEMRLHQRFDHEVGRLHHEKEVAKAEATGVAAELVAMMSKPEGMRQLIIASEILRRPF